MKAEERFSLIARLEGGLGPDQELDELIAMKVAGFKPTVTLGHEVLGNLRTVPAYPPKYTSSLDAALALVERVNAPDALLLLENVVSDMFQAGYRQDQPHGPQVARVLLAALLRTLEPTQ